MIRPRELSARELQVLRATAEGLQDRQIGQRYFIAASTVKFHQTHIRQKLAARTRAHAVAIAANHGLLAATGDQESA